MSLLGLGSVLRNVHYLSVVNLVTIGNHELGCCMKLGFACSNIREQPLSIRQAVYNMLKHD